VICGNCHAPNSRTPNSVRVADRHRAAKADTVPSAERPRARGQILRQLRSVAHAMRRWAAAAAWGAAGAAYGARAEAATRAHRPIFERQPLAGSLRIGRRLGRRPDRAPRRRGHRLFLHPPLLAPPLRGNPRCDASDAGGLHSAALSALGTAPEGGAARRAGGAADSTARPRSTCVPSPMRSARGIPDSNSKSSCSAPR